MNLRARNRTLAGLALAAACAAGVFATASGGCQSRCASDCPNPVASIFTEVNVDPGILGIGWVGPACPLKVDCRGDGRTTFCNQIDVIASAPGICEVWVDLYGRDRMAVRLEFGPLPTAGCCRGYPVVGESLFVIPVATDAGIQGLDGSSDAVRILRDGGDGDTDDGGAADTAAD
jgi:hypothetical protein